MDFEFSNPTRMVFGAGKIAELGAKAKVYGSTALLVTGGGSVKANGTYDKAVASLEASGIKVVGCDGIEPNPRITSVRRGADLARANNCDLVIALGGGSTMDASKAIAAAFYYEGDPWDMVHHGQENVVTPTKALPIITVPTLAATGSETNSGSVITNEETQEKSFMGAPCLFPSVAIIDPELTLSVPKNHTAYGVCDLITHITESYFNGVGGTPIQDLFAESVIKTAIEYGRKVVADGSDLEARTQIQWASILALNGWVSVGTKGGFPVHMIEHTVSAFHDIPHAAGLAIINPSWMRFAAKVNPQKFVQFAERVFGLSSKGSDDLGCALKGIDLFEDFLKEIGCPTHLSEVGIDDSKLSLYAQETLRIVGQDGYLYGKPPMSEEDIVNVLKAAL